MRFRECGPCLWRSGVARIKLYPGTRLNTREDHTQYLSVRVGVRGGGINYFVHGQKLKKLIPKPGGKAVEVTGRLAVFEKTVGDIKTVYVNVELRPDDTPVTHRIIAHSAAGDFVRREETVFAIPIPGTEGVLEIRKLAQAAVAEVTAEVSQAHHA